MNFIRSVVFLLSSIFSICAIATPISLPVANADFEAKLENKLTIPGWYRTQHAGVFAYKSEVTNKKCKQGKQCFMMNQFAPQSFGTARQELPVSGLEGKRVRLSALLRTEKVGPEGSAIYIVEHSDGNIREAYTSEKRVGTSKWRELSVECTIGFNINSLIIGVTLNDLGTIWVDDVKLLVLDQEGGKK